MAEIFAVEGRSMRQVLEEADSLLLILDSLVRKHSAAKVFAREMTGYMVRIETALRSICRKVEVEGNPADQALCHSLEEDLDKTFRLPAVSNSIDPSAGGSLFQSLLLQPHPDAVPTSATASGVLVAEGALDSNRIDFAAKLETLRAVRTALYRSIVDSWEHKKQ